MKELRNRDFSPATINPTKTQLFQNNSFIYKRALGFLYSLKSGAKAAFPLLNQRNRDFHSLFSPVIVLSLAGLKSRFRWFFTIHPYG